MDTLIIYNTRHGATKQYAEWLAERLQNCTVLRFDDIDSTLLEGYKTFVLMGPVYMGRLKYIGNFLRMYHKQLRGKQITICAIGIMPKERDFTEMLSNDVPIDLAKNIDYYKLPGEVDINKLSLFEKFIYTSVTGKRPNHGHIDSTTLDNIEDSIK